MLYKFPDSFPVDLPALPLERDIYIIIDLELGTKPISIPSYMIPLQSLRISKPNFRVSYIRDLFGQVYLHGVLLCYLLRRRE